MVPPHIKPLIKPVACRDRMAPMKVMKDLKQKKDQKNQKDKDQKDQKYQKNEKDPLYTGWIPQEMSKVWNRSWDKFWCESVVVYNEFVVETWTPENQNPPDADSLSTQPEHTWLVTGSCKKSWSRQWGAYWLQEIRMHDEKVVEVWIISPWGDRIITPR